MEWWEFRFIGPDALNAGSRDILGVGVSLLLDGAPADPTARTVQVRFVPQFPGGEVVDYLSLEWSAQVSTIGALTQYLAYTPIGAGIEGLDLGVGDWQVWVQAVPMEEGPETPAVLVGTLGVRG